MRIKGIIERTIPLKSNLSNSQRSLKEMKTTIIAVISDVIRERKPLIGFGFSSIGRASYGAQVRERIAPRLLGADPHSLLDASGANFDPVRLLSCAMQNEKPGGDAERSVAMGTFDVAVWDLVAKIEEKPLHRVLAERYSKGRVLDRIFCYVGGGWYFPGQTLEDLQAEMRQHQEAGYSMVKIKIGGSSLGEDCKRIESALKVMGKGSNLAVDSNAAFSREAAIDFGKAIAPYHLRWYEEPCHPLDFESYKAVAQSYESPLASGENLFAARELENFLLYSGFRGDRDIIQIDPPCAYGITGYLKIIEVAEKYGFTRKSMFPHGGNLMGLNIAGGLGLGGCESYPGVFGVVGGFNEEVRISDGCATLPESPGLGFEAKPELFPIMKDLVS
jgi:D(-)-tartrate dehydratase